MLNIRLGPEFSMHYILHFVWHMSSLPPTSLISISACPPCDTFSRTDNESTCPHRWEDGTPNDQSEPLAPWFAHLVLSGRVSCFVFPAFSNAPCVFDPRCSGPQPSCVLYFGLLVGLCSVLLPLPQHSARTPGPAPINWQ